MTLIRRKNIYVYIENLIMIIINIYNYLQEKDSKIIELLQIKFLFFLYFYMLLL